MDGVSTAINLFSSGYTAFKKVREVRQAIKDAPDQLDSLERSCSLNEQLLDHLKAACSYLPAHNDLYDITHLSQQAQRHFDKVQKIADKVTEGYSSGDRSTGKRKIRHVKWILHKDSTEKIEVEMKELQTTLGILLVSVQRHYFTLLLTKVSNVETALAIRPQPGLFIKAGHEHGADCPAPLTTRNGELDAGYDTIRQTMHTIGPSRVRSNNLLRCLPECECRCHYPAIAHLLPTWLALYTGQVSVSKRLLRSPSPCNVQTCRGDTQRAYEVQWILPATGPLQGCLQSSKHLDRIHFLIGAPRLVPFDAPIYTAVVNGDFKYVCDLFATGQASIWDYTMSGMPVFWSACAWWQRNPNEDRLKIIQLFAEAGADVLLFEEAPTSYSAHDLLAMSFFKCLVDGIPDETRSLATIVRTNPAAINILRSLFKIDPMDALADYLDRKRARSIDIAGFLAWLEDTHSNPASRSSVVKVTGCTFLKYSIAFSPDSVESLLLEGEDAAVEPTLAYALCSGNSFLIKFLLDAGADVNMRDLRGYTVLHSACSRCSYRSFCELLRWAEGTIDWNACTPEGQNALELFDLGVSGGWAQNSRSEADWATGLSRSQIGTFREVLMAHMNVDEEEFSQTLQFEMPGAFPPYK